MPEREQTKDAAGKFDRVLTDDQLTAIAVGLIHGKSQSELARELDIPRASVGRVARDPTTRALVSEERAKLSIKASNRRAEISRAHAEGRPVPPDVPKSMVFDPELQALRPFQGGRILGVFGARQDGGYDTLYDASKRSDLTSYADEQHYVRVPRDPMPEQRFATLHCNKFSKSFDPTEPHDISSALELADDYFPKMNRDRLRTTLEAAKPGEVIQLPDAR